MPVFRAVPSAGSSSVTAKLRSPLPTTAQGLAVLLSFPSLLSPQVGVACVLTENTDQMSPNLFISYTTGQQELLHTLI